MCITIVSFNTYFICKTENGNHDMISALDISDSQMKINNNLPVPRRRGRNKTTQENSNPLKRPIRKSKKGSSSDNPSKELWKCNFCQKVFRLHNVKSISLTKNIDLAGIYVA